MLLVLLVFVEVVWIFVVVLLLLLLLLLLCLFHVVFGVGVACVCSLVKGGWIFACRGSLDFVVAGVFVPLWFLVLELLCVSVFWSNEGCGTRLRMREGRRRRLD